VYLSLDSFHISDNDGPLSKVFIISKREITLKNDGIRRGSRDLFFGILSDRRGREGQKSC
jgi:hypothetical protein